MGRYVEEDNQNVEAAEQLFERLIGYQLTAHEVTEEHKVEARNRSQIQLKREPTELLFSEGFVSYPELRYEGWHEIELATINKWGRVLSIPPSIFGTPYERVKVIYLTGAVEIPKDVKFTIQEMSDLLAKPNIDVWNIPLSESALETIEKYKRLGGGT